MTRFRRMYALQKFSAVHACFNSKRHLTGRDPFRANRSAALAEERTLAAQTPTWVGRAALGGDKAPLV